MNKTALNMIPGSFRDPSGFVFFQDGKLYRQVNQSYKPHFDLLITSGLYEVLVSQGDLIPHREMELSAPDAARAYKIIKPDPLPFVSYPYEWCFSQLKDAALLTLKIQKTALEHGMSLKDCSAFNVQFKGCTPVFIDTLSFEAYQTGSPWVAYRQFCQSFLVPLALISYRDYRLNQLSYSFINGIPLDLASALLPLRTLLNFSLLSHIHLHARSQKRFADNSLDVKNYTLNKTALLGIVDNLEGAVRRLKWTQRKTTWGEYYEDTNYSDEAFEHKKTIVADLLGRIHPRTVWDLGANRGVFSQIASEQGADVVTLDMDPLAVEKCYLTCSRNPKTKILPLCVDLTNPSADIGWAHEERMSLISRGPAGAVLALALIHHLVITNNIPFEKIAEFFENICDTLIIEFVPKTDSQVQRMLANREDVFLDYTQESFERSFGRSFEIVEAVPVTSSGRVIYYFKNKRSKKRPT